MPTPSFNSPAFLAPNATIRGNVVVGRDSSIFYGSVVRAETKPAIIGERSNIQDNCTLHTDVAFPINIGNEVSIGHGVIVHACTIGDNTVVGMGSIILNGAVIGKNCIIGAGSLVTQGMVIPDGMMAFGSPAKIRRPLTDEEIAKNKKTALHYIEVSRHYAELENQAK